MTPKHEKRTTYVKQPDGSIKITAKSYYEELAHMVEEVEKPYHNLDSIAASEVVTHALERITSDESVQTIVTIKKQGGKIKILERYTSIKQNFGNWK